MELQKIYKLYEYSLNIENQISQFLFLEIIFIKLFKAVGHVFDEHLQSALGSEGEEPDDQVQQQCPFSH